MHDPISQDTRPPSPNSLKPDRARRLAKAHSLRGESLLAEGRYAEAAREFRQGITAHRTYVRAWWGAARAHRALGDGESAQRCYEITHQLTHPNKETALDYAAFLGEHGEWDAAQRILCRHLDTDLDEQDVKRAAVDAVKHWCDATLRTSTIIDLNYQPRPRKVTALVSTYCSEAFMRECLTDLLAQTIGDNLEILVLDAASPQNERAIVEEFQRRTNNIRYVRTAGRIGIYPAWNLLARLAQGTYLAPMSTNDRVCPNAYEAMARALDENADADLVYGNSYLTDLPHQNIGNHHPSKVCNGAYVWRGITYEWMLYECGVGPHPMWRRSVHETVGYFDSRYWAIGDQDFFMRIARLGGLRHIDTFTGMQWLTTDSLSGRATAFREIFDIHRKYQLQYQRDKGVGYPPDRLEMLIARFVDIIIRMAEAGARAEALDFYATHRAMFGAREDMARIDGIMEGLRLQLTRK